MCSFKLDWFPGSIYKLFLKLLDKRIQNNEIRVDIVIILINLDCLQEVHILVEVSISIDIKEPYIGGLLKRDLKLMLK